MKTLLILACLIVAATAQTCSWAHICKDHTMCKYPGPNCPGQRYSGVNRASDKQAVVDEHNRVRRIVANGQETRGSPGPQPPAANMNQLVWDDKLATVAQRWADQCIFDHDTCRNDDRFHVGQNIRIAYSRGSPENDVQDWRGTVQAWYNEVSKYSRNNVNSYVFSSDTGHYTQVVWANTRYVGCGFSAYKSSDGYYNKLYVCNYGPSGNYKGSPIYTQGSACSRCPSGTRCVNSLCA